MRSILTLCLLTLSTTALADGKATYDSMCSSCHGATGAGDGVAAAALNPKPASFADAAFWKRVDETGHGDVKGDAYIKKVLKEGGAAVGKSPMMAPLGAAMTDEQIKAVTTYIRSLKKDG